MAGHCRALSAPNTDWNFCPNVGAAYFYAVVFALVTVAHFVQMIVYRKLYSLVIVLSAALQTTTYICRIVSIKNPAASGPYAAWFVLMMIAPIFTNAFAFMAMGRMVYNFTKSASVAKISAWRFGQVFVTLDIIAFFVQAGGAIIASGNNITTQTIMTGLHIYQGGIAFQQLGILAFLFIAVRFHLGLRQHTRTSRVNVAFTLLYVEYAVVFLISIRIIFRVIEYSNGINSSIPNHEVYQYIFDSTLMLLALVLLNIFHPARLMAGKESDLPSRKARKAARKTGQPISGRLEKSSSTESKDLHMPVYTGV